MKTASPNYQSIAESFQVGDYVIPHGSPREVVGVVGAVYAGIGMVDVEYPTGTKRFPAEELLRLDKNSNPVPVQTGYTPGGEGSGRGKTALYWAAADRRYKATNEEKTAHRYICPKCKKQALRKAIYRRLKGKSERLFGCSSCFFLIERDSILGIE